MKDVFIIIQETHSSDETYDGGWVDSASRSLLGAVSTEEEAKRLVEALNAKDAVQRKGNPWTSSSTYEYESCQLGSPENIDDGACHGGPPTATWDPKEGGGSMWSWTHADEDCGAWAPIRGRRRMATT